MYGVVYLATVDRTIADPTLGEPMALGTRVMNNRFWISPWTSRSSLSFSFKVLSSLFIHSRWRHSAAISPKLQWGTWAQSSWKLLKSRKQSQHFFISGWGITGIGTWRTSTICKNKNEVFYNLHNGRPSCSSRSSITTVIRLPRSLAIPEVPRLDTKRYFPLKYPHVPRLDTKRYFPLKYPHLNSSSGPRWREYSMKSPFHWYERATRPYMAFMEFIRVNNLLDISFWLKSSILQGFHRHGI